MGMHGNGVIPILPSGFSILPHSQYCELFPYSWESHGIPIPLAWNHTPMVVSTADLYNNDAVLATTLSLSDCLM